MRGNSGRPDRLSRRALLCVLGSGSVAIAGSLASPIAGPNANEAPRATAVDPSHSVVTVPIGGETAFVARATDGERNLTGMEWYVDGEFHTAGALGGASATDALTWSFAEPGTHVVEALAYDT